MDLGLTNAGLLWGLTLASVPVILHLLMRQQPRPIVFPALRFIKTIRRRTMRRVRLRHLLLLLLRVAAVAALVLALARPKDRTGTLVSRDDAPGAAVLVIDNSLSMQYRQQGRTALEAAKAMALDVLGEYPTGSQVAVLDTAQATGMLSLDVARAKQRIEQMGVSAINNPCNDALAEGIRLCRKSDLERREVYVFTDMSARSWRLGGAPILAPDPADEPSEQKVAVYVVDLGPKKPTNVRIADLRLSAETTPVNAEVHVTVTVQNGAEPIQSVIDLHLDDRKVAGEPLAIEANGSQTVRFQMVPDRPGIHQGRVQIALDDPLPADNVRYFTIQTAPKRRIQVAGDAPQAVRQVRLALAPPGLVRQKLCPNEVVTGTGADIGRVPLAQFDCMFLTDVARLTNMQWGLMREYVHSGGGVAVLAGPTLDVANYNGAGAQAFLPAKLGAVKESPKGWRLVVPDRAHPVLARFLSWTEMSLRDQRFFRYVEADPNKGAVTVLGYANGDPALLDLTYGQGRVVLWTSSADRAWNNLPLTPEYVVLIDQVSQYLSGAQAETLNCEVGETARLSIRREDRREAYVLHRRGEDVLTRVAPQANSRMLAVPAGNEVGLYVLESGTAGDTLRKGFAVNWPVDEARFDRVEPEALEQVLGRKPDAIATDATELAAAAGEARVGRELFHYVMLLVLAAMTVEGFLSNRLYRQ